MQLVLADKPCYLTSCAHVASTLAVRSWNIFVFISTIGGIALVGILATGYWLLWEIGQTKKYINQLRQNHASHDDDNIGKNDRVSRSFDLEEELKKTDPLTKAGKLCSCMRRILRKTARV